MGTNYRKKKLLNSVLAGPTSQDDVGLSFYAPLNDLGSGQVNIALSRGVGAGTFIRATSATTINATGSVINVATGIPRSCYSPTGVYLGYLAEEARTNICLQSDAFDNATWVKTGCTVTADAGVSPAGSISADLFLPTNLSAGNASRINQSFTVTASQPQVFSIWMKASGETTIELTNQGAWSVVETGSLTFTLTGNGSVASGGTKTGTITAYPSGWYRCTMLVTSTATPGTGGIQIQQAAALTGNGTNGVLLWGAQLEDSKTFATSYIPTTIAAVTRNADVLSYPTASNTLGTDGTGYAEVTYATLTSGTDVMSAFTGTGAIVMNLVSGGAIGLFDGVSRSVPCGLPAAPVANPLKVASKWSSLALQVNAAQNGTLGTAQPFDGDMNFGVTMWMMTRNNGASNFPNGTIKNARIWTRALNDIDMVGITR